MAASKATADIDTPRLDDMVFDFMINCMKGGHPLSDVNCQVLFNDKSNKHYVCIVLTKNDKIIMRIDYYIGDTYDIDRLAVYMNKLLEFITEDLVHMEITEEIDYKRHASLFGLGYGVQSY